MQLTTVLLSAAALLASGTHAKKCTEVDGSKPFFIQALVGNAYENLYVRSTDTDPSNPDNIYHGFSTASPTGATTQDHVKLKNGNLLAVSTQYPKMDPFQTTFIFNASQINVVPKFQSPPEDTGLGLVAAPKGGFGCVLAFDGDASGFYLCPNSKGENDLPFLSYFSSGPAAVCNHTRVLAANFA